MTVSANERAAYHPNGPPSAASPWPSAERAAVEELVSDPEVALTDRNHPASLSRGSGGGLDRSGIAKARILEAKPSGPSSIPSLAWSVPWAAGGLAAVSAPRWVIGSGKPYWGQGFATEAGAALLRYGFETLGLNRIFAHHMRRNPLPGG
jgi:hypothetical protein